MPSQKKLGRNSSEDQKYIVKEDFVLCYNIDVEACELWVKCKTVLVI